MRGKAPILVAGLVTGALAICLTVAGNPPNMGVCIACFLRDITGALRLHTAPPVQYLRPEILGLVLGAFASALAAREFRVTGGASTFTRFVLGMFVMIGFLVFLGCPLRMTLRLAAGDLNALLGLCGLLTGVAIGVLFISRGFSLGRAVPQARANGYVFPGLAAFLLVLFLAAPGLFAASAEGPGAAHAPALFSLAAGLFIGALAQRTRLCLVGGFRDLIFFRDYYLITGFIGLFAAALIGNLLLGNFHAGFSGQPIAHTDGIWNFLGMTLAGLGSVLLGGCPLRQLVAASEGNTDAAVTVFGYIVGAALAHNFGLAASPKGVPPAGQFAVLVGLVVVFGLAAVLTATRTTTERSVVRGSSN